MVEIHCPRVKETQRLEENLDHQIHRAHGDRLRTLGENTPGECEG
jgi:hypothetical protein